MVGWFACDALEVFWIGDSQFVHHGLLDMGKDGIAECSCICFACADAAHELAGEVLDLRGEGCVLAHRTHALSPCPYTLSPCLRTLSPCPHTLSPCPHTLSPCPCLHTLTPCPSPTGRGGYSTLRTCCMGGGCALTPRPSPTGRGGELSPNRHPGGRGREERGEAGVFGAQLGVTLLELARDDMQDVGGDERAKSQTRVGHGGRELAIEKLSHGINQLATSGTVLHMGK